MKARAAIIVFAAPAMWLSACATPSFVPPPVVDARYVCADGATLAVRFDNRADTATVTGAGRVTVLRG